MAMQKCFLVCNAHLDPVWLWPWEDGMTETLSTFRVAADFCEQYPDFVFNHNESLLYEWVEEHDPALFERIHKLVRQGSWHIAGGAYLQPDPIGTSGESMIRQYLVGKLYFQEKFATEPTTAYNFDSFGHPRGLIQILAGCGFDSYIFCRPAGNAKELPVGAFRWQHPSGAEIIARRSDDHYITQGEIRKSMRDGDWPAFYRSEGDFLFLWGLGNHGGGPSHAEYAQFSDMRQDFPNVEFIESTPEAFFRRTLQQRPRATLPVQQDDLQPQSEGCYTSMLRIKQTHRRMENLIALTERLTAITWWRGISSYPAAELRDAWKDILFSEFHDILPGSGIPTVEADCLTRLGHCEEILRRHKARALIRLLRHEPLAERNRTPIFVFNPHGWEVTQEVEIEYCIDRQFTPDQIVRTLSSGGQPVPAQFEKAEHNLLDKNWGEWRQRAVFTATIPPLSYRRFDADYTVLPKDQIKTWRSPELPTGDKLIIPAGTLQVSINLRTGLLDEVLQGQDVILHAGSALPLVFNDMAHAWETFPEWRQPAGAFRLATPQEAARIRGSARTNPGYAAEHPAVSILEDGPMRTIVEAVFVYEDSYLVQRYLVHKHRPLLHIDQDIFWNQHDQLLSLELQHHPKMEQIQTERCYSIDDRTTDAASGTMLDAQHFVRLVDAKSGQALGVISYGPSGWSHQGQSLRLHTLRSAPYSGMDDVPADCDRFHHRYIIRHDQGHRTCRYTLALGTLSPAALARTAWECHQALVPWVYFPTTKAAAAPVSQPFVAVDAANVMLTVVKKSEQGDDLVLRFWEVAGQKTSFTFTVEGRAYQTAIGAHQLKTVRISKAGNLLLTDLLERPI